MDFPDLSIAAKLFAQISGKEDDSAQGASQQGGTAQVQGAFGVKEGSNLIEAGFSFFQGLLSQKDGAATTELYHPASAAGSAQSCAGYAPAGDPGPTYQGPHETFKLDSDKMIDWIPSDPRLSSYLANRARFDFGGGSGSIGRHSFTKENFAEYVKNELRNNPTFRAAFEADFGVKVDLGVQTKDNEIAVYRPGNAVATPVPAQQGSSSDPAVGAPAPAQQGSASAPAASSCRPPPGSSTDPFGRGCGTAPAPDASGDASTHLDPNIGDYRDCLQTLLQNWEVFDTAVGTRDEYLTKDNLRAIKDNPAASQVLKQAATFLLSHPEYFNRLEMAAGVGGKDGIVGKGDVVGDLTRVNGEIAMYGLPSNSGSSSAGASTAADPAKDVGAASQAADDSATDATAAAQTASGAAQSSDSSAMTGLGGGGLSTGASQGLDGRLEKILERGLGSMDGQLEGLLREIETGKDASGNAVKPEVAQFRLQSLMQRRTAIFTMLSTLSEKFNEMAKTAIGNMGRA